MFERATWPLRKLVWKIEEKVVWPIADVLSWRPRRQRIRVEAPPAPAEARGGEVDAPSGARPAPLAIRRLGAPVRDVSVVLATVAVAAGAGIAIAMLVDSSGGTSVSRPPAQDAASQVGIPSPQASAESGGSATLEGAPPDFRSAPQAGTQEQVSPTEATNSKPSSISAGAAGTTGAMETARDFAGAFVLYEVGESGKEVRQTFARTATPSLATALRDRPPRLPEGVKVPSAKVQNVVLGARHGNEMDASVSLLRLGDLSELRLTLIRRDGRWAVSEVRG